jgi:methyl-accepting chemotaxis protein WspA
VRLDRGNDPFLDADCYFGTMRLGQSDWTIVVRKPSAEVLGDLLRLMALNLGTALIGIAIIAIILISLVVGVGRRLDLAVGAADRIAGGDLSQEVPEGAARDESGRLLSSFRSMSGNLNRIVSQVRRASIQVNSTATELTAMSRQQEEVATGFSASTSEVAAATRQISTTGEELLRTMQTVAESAVGAARQAEEGREGLQGMQEAMGRLEEAATSVGTRLSAINEKAQGVTTIVGTITKVADQTNLLSVNAAIEAEKAGEFGVGFLVVAREIRRLADQTAAATLDIERMVRQMQTAVSSGVMEMDRFGEALRKCLVEVDRVGERLAGIIAHVAEDTRRFGQVTEGMRSQAAGASQIDEAMRTLSSGARQTSQSAAEFGKAASDLQGAIVALKGIVSGIQLREGA